MKNFKKALLFISLALPLLIGAYSACSAPNSQGNGATNNPPGTPEITASPFWLEPTNETTIAIGQTINVFAALKANPNEMHQIYINPASIQWSNSNSSFASIALDGSVTGLAAGNTKITSTYQTYSGSVEVKVSGTLSNRNVAVAGQTGRHYLIYVPPFSTAGPHPLVLSLHGGGGTAMQQAASSQLIKTAVANNFYVAFLEGTGVLQTFNAGSCCGSAQSKNIDDVLYVSKVLDDIQANFNTDTNKVIATGFSNGAIMSHRLACELSNRISGIAAVSGGSGEFDFNHNSYFTCAPTRPIPILHIHAKNDRNYPYGGGQGLGTSGTHFYPVEDSTNDWISRNNVTSQATIESVGTITKCSKYTNVANSSKPSAPVALCVLEPVDVYDSTEEIVYGGGHSWPNGVRSISTKSDIPTTLFDANSYIWNYLLKP